MAKITINGRMTVKELKDLFYNAFEGVLRIYKGRSSAPDDVTLASISANTDVDNKELVCKDTQTAGEFVEQIKQVLGIGLKVATKDDWVVVLDYIRLSQIKDIPKKATLDYMKTNFPESAQANEEKVSNEESIKVEKAPAADKAEKGDLMDMLERYLPTIENEKDKKSLKEFIARERKQRHFDANSYENSKEYWEKTNQDGSHNELRDLFEVLQKKKWTIPTWLAVYKAAQRGNVIAQYKWGYLLRSLSIRKFYEESKNEFGYYVAFVNPPLLKEDYEWFNKEVVNKEVLDLPNAPENAAKWLTKAAEQGLGIAMYTLCEHLIYGPLFNTKEALYWMEKHNEIRPWKSISLKDDIVLFNEKTYRLYCKLQTEKAKLESSAKDLESKNNGEASKYAKLVRDYNDLLERKNKLMDERNELVRDYNNLLDRKNSIQSKYESLQDDYADLQSKYSSAQSRPSRPSADDIVKVRVMYLKRRTIGWNTRETKIVEMTRRDYKQLAEGSMKNRIAYVNNKFKNSWNIDGLEEVHVELV